MSKIVGESNQLLQRAKDLFGQQKFQEGQAAFQKLIDLGIAGTPHDAPVSYDTSHDASTPHDAPISYDPSHDASTPHDAAMSVDPSHDPGTCQ